MVGVVGVVGVLGVVVALGVVGVVGVVYCGRPVNRGGRASSGGAVCL